MGNKQSNVQKSSQEVLNNIIMNVIVNHNNSQYSMQASDAILTIGEGAKVTNFNIIQKNSLSLDTLTSTTGNAKLQTSITNALLNTIKNDQKMTNPIFTTNKGKQISKSKISTLVKKHFSTSAIEKLVITSYNKAHVTVEANGILDGGGINQDASAVTKQVSKLTNDIISVMDSENMLDSDMRNKQETSFMNVNWIALAIICVCIVVGMISFMVYKRSS